MYLLHFIFLVIHHSQPVICWTITFLWHWMTGKFSAENNWHGTTHPPKFTNKNLDPVWPEPTHLTRPSPRVNPIRGPLGAPWKVLVRSEIVYARSITCTSSNQSVCICVSGGTVLALFLGLLLGICIAVFTVTTFCCSRRLLWVFPISRLHYNIIIKL